MTSLDWRSVALAASLVAVPAWGQSTSPDGSTIAAGGPIGGDPGEGSPVSGDLLMNNGCIGDGSGWSVSGTNGPFGGFKQYQRFTVPEPGWNITAIGVEGHLTFSPNGTGMRARVWPDDGTGTGPDESGDPLTTRLYFLANDPFSCENWQDGDNAICLDPGDYWLEADDDNDADYIASLKNGTSGGPAYSYRNSDMAEFPHGPVAVRIFGTAESCAASCFTVIDEELVCQGDGTTFTYTVQGTESCTGDVSTYSFTGTGGAVGEEMCFTLLIGENGLCCTEQFCVIVPDCDALEGNLCSADLDGDGEIGILDLLLVLGSWNQPGGDVDGDGTTDIQDFLAVLAQWGACP